VVWYEYGYPISHHRIRRSDDFGATFGPEHTVTDYYENGRSGAPGFRRTFAPTLPGIAVDHSNGPYRGRVYVTWDEAVNFYDTPLSLVSPIAEVEDNGFFASATSFAVGDVLRGSIASSAEFDLFRFSGLKGQTVFFAADSTRDSTNLTLRLICESDTSMFDDYRLLALTAGRFPSFAFTLPADGSFTLRLNGSGPTPGPYRLLTGFDTPSGERATDHRDQFLATSDDGATWNTPVQLNDSEPGFDGIFPEVAVDGLGRVHVYWHDFRDDIECGALSFEYLVSSGDGGTTWGPNRKLSDVTSFWSANACGTANQGDYQGITAEGATIYPLWADSRLGDPDVFFEATTMSMLAVCPKPATGVGTVERTFSVANTGNVEATIAWSLTDTRGWITPAGSPGVALGAGGSVDPVVEVAFPPDCEGGEVDTLLLTLENVDVPGHVEVCVTTATCLGPLAVERLVRALELAAPRPNPSRGQVVLRFGLSRTGQIRLGVFGAHGERVRSLVNADHEAGPHEISWDGRNDQGRRVGPGVYFVRLDAEGRSLRQVVTVLH
jgi:hypothetical protein